ncbi:MAG TPA: alpha/beta hydrolase [Streptosporangiaceae bacterium]|nr:alpha/beta hydrolase [Streptosporangiaceae bacterium]
MLLIHAGGFGAWFGPLAADPALGRFRRIRIIRAGYASGPPPARHVTVADQARHCAAVLDTLQITQAHVLAHSSGCLPALQLALDRPELVGSLALLEPALVGALADPADAEALGRVLGPAVAAAAAGDTATAFDTFMRTICAPDYRDVLTAALGPEGLDHAERNCQFFFLDEIAAAGEWIFDHNAASQIRQPALLMAGACSPPPVHRGIARVAAMLPHVQTTTIQDADHLLPLRNPAALGWLVTQFARRHSLGPARRASELTHPAAGNE